MEENKVTTPENVQETEELSFFNFRSLLQTFILNWQWFALSLIICLGMTAIYLRYTTPRYASQAKMLIKDEDNQRGRNPLMNATNLGFISNTEGIDNEIQRGPLLRGGGARGGSDRCLRRNMNYH